MTCYTPGNEAPVVVIMGASGTGKTSVAERLGEALGLHVVESEELAEQAVGSSISSMMISDPERGLELLRDAALRALLGGAGAGTILVLSASAPLDPQVAAAVDASRELAARTVALTASLDTLVRRNGLNAARPTALGTPRAWFRSQVQAVEEAYSPIADYWCDTDTCAPAACAHEIIANLGLNPVHD